MMLKPPMKDLLAQIDNRYMLVNIAAKRARDISENAEECKITLEDKPVKMALDDIASGRISVIKADDEEKA